MNESAWSKRGEALRARLRSSGGRTRGRGRGYGAQARAEAVAYVTESLAVGRRLGEVAEQLGVHAQTLRAWVQAAPEPRAFLPVAVRQDEPPVTASARRTLTLIARGGWRIEGLELGEVHELLRSLG